jgi:hypothetical protein
LDSADHERLWSDLQERTPHPMCDNSSAIKVRYHFLRDHVEKGDIVMKYSDTERQLVDIFMKPLDVTCFASLCVGGGGLGVFHPYGLV